jgi:hypothetical protein
MPAPGFSRVAGWVLSVTACAALMLMICDAREQIWKFYVIPAEALVSVLSGCSAEANENFGIQAAMWRNDRPINAYNPYQRERDEHIQSCVKADGWCVYSGAGAPGIVGAWAFAPRDSVAKCLYDHRYRHGVHLECS